MTIDIVSLITFWAVAILLVSDHVSGTAFYQRKATPMFTPDHFDIFSDDEHDNEHGSTADYWEAYADALESRGFSVTDADGFTLMTDSELAELSEDVDLFAFDSAEEEAEFLAAVFETDSLAADLAEEEYYERLAADDSDVDIWSR